MLYFSKEAWGWDFWWCNHKYLPSFPSTCGNIIWSKFYFLIHIYLFCWWVWYFIWLHAVPIHIFTLVGASSVVDRVYRSCLISLVGYNTWVDLIILGMIDFDIILGMDWLSLHHIILVCYSKIVTLAMWGVPRNECMGASGFYPIKVIFFIRAQIFVDR